MDHKYDVIVIGSGIAALTAAALLSKKGKKVLVLEKNSFAGGYAANFKRGGFEFDASLHMINGCACEGSTYEILKKCGVENKIQFLKHNYLYRSIFPDFDLKIPQGDLKSTIQLLTKYFPHEASGIEKLFDEMLKMFHEARKLLHSKMPGWLEILCAPFKYPRFFSYANSTFKILLDGFIKDERLKAIISQTWGYYGLPPSRIFSFYFAYGCYDFTANGGFYPKGGSQAFADAFVEAIKSNGSDVFFDSEVEKIIMKKNCAEGVRTKKGDEFQAQTVISNVDVRKTFCDFVGCGYYPKNFIKKTCDAQDSISAFQLYLGLNVDLREKGIEDYEIFVNPGYDLDKQFEACCACNIKEAPYIMTFYSQLEPASVQKGKFVMGVVVLSGYEPWKNLTQKAYEEKKSEYAKLLIQRIEKVIPNFSSMIETMEVATPLTMERTTGNHHGAIYGFSPSVEQSGIRRLNLKTRFVKNLYLASAWTRPGGGFAGVMVAGERVAEMILRGH
jgi:prolycopene isomerase